MLKFQPNPALFHVRNLFYLEIKLQIQSERCVSSSLNTLIEKGIMFFCDTQLSGFVLGGGGGCFRVLAAKREHSM